MVKKVEEKGVGAKTIIGIGAGIAAATAAALSRTDCAFIASICDRRSVICALRVVLSALTESINLLKLVALVSATEAEVDNTALVKATIPLTLNGPADNGAYKFHVLTPLTSAGETEPVSVTPPSCVEETKSVERRFVYVPSATGSPAASLADNVNTTTPPLTYVALSNDNDTDETVDDPTRTAEIEVIVGDVIAFANVIFAAPKEFPCIANVAIPAEVTAEAAIVATAVASDVA